MIESKFYVSQDQAKLMQIELDRAGYKRPGGKPQPAIDMVMVVAGIGAVIATGITGMIAIGLMIGAF
jgi:hypothetical protein